MIHFGYEFSYDTNSALSPAPEIPLEIRAIIRRFPSSIVNSSGSAFSPDQVTVNIYEPGQGIPPHVDTHSAFEEPIVSLSLLSDVVMEFRDCANVKAVRNAFLPARSLMVMTGASRFRFKHGSVITSAVNLHRSFIIFYLIIM